MNDQSDATSDSVPIEVEGRIGAAVVAILWPFVLTATLALSAANFAWGEVNQDEGWYLYAARLVSEGEFPYIDFATTQGPVMSFVYVLALPLVKVLGVAGGRLFTRMLGLGAAATAAWLASRLMTIQGGRLRRARGCAALMSFAFVGVNVYQSYFCTIVKTYSLASWLLLMGCVGLTYARVDVGKKRCAWSEGAAGVLAGMFFALAAGTRLSAGLVIPIACVLMWEAMMRRRRREVLPDDSLSDWSVSGAHVVGLVLGAGVTLSIVFGVFLVKAPEALKFALFDYHAGRAVNGVTTLVAYKPGI